MTLLEQINAWLNSPVRCFQVGLQLFVKASNNRSLMLYLQRKSDMKKLEYELEKAVKLNHVRLERMEAVQFATAESIDETIIPTAKKKLQSGDQGDHKIIEPRKINREDLPEEMQKIYDEVSEAYKLQRVNHEKMKLAQTDADRAAYRNIVIEYDTVISEGWKALDEYELSKNQPKKTKNVDAGKTQTSAEVAKKINACRSYISRGINDYPSLEGKKKLDRLEEIRKRVDTLINIGATVKKETKDQLITLGIIDKNNTLLVELPIDVKPIK